MTNDQINAAVGPDTRTFCAQIAQHGFTVVNMLAAVPHELYTRAAELHRQQSIESNNPQASTRHKSMAETMDCLAEFSKKLMDINQAALVQANALNGNHTN